ncbi:MAG: MFS transporter [Thermoproteales archaeon]|nr:MFS transporter [Thermoproteales archaeon]
MLAVVGLPMAGALKRYVEAYRAWGRNARVLVITEPLWSVPMSWIFFYRPIYLRELAFSEAEIGLLYSIPLVLQLFMPLLGGYLADRFGRKRTFMLFDAVGWLGAVLIWASTSDRLLIALAFVFEGLVSTTYAVWECLLVEDTGLEYRASIYGAVQVIFLVGSLLTPLAGAVVDAFGVASGFRLISWLALASLVAMYAIRQALLAEPPATRLIEERGASSYREVLGALASDRRMLSIMAVNTLAGFMYPMAWAIPLYLTDERALGLDPGLASTFQTASAIPSIALLLTLTPRLAGGALATAIRASYLAGAAGMALLAAAPHGAYCAALAASALDSFRYVASFALVRTYLNNSIDSVDPKLRAKLLSLATTLSAVASLPAPAASGLAYAAGPRLVPLLLALLSLACSLLTR